MALRISEVALVAVADAAEGEKLCRQLTSCGWQVLSVYDGAAALGALCSRPVTLAVIGVDLPAMGGIEVVASARAAGWHESVVFIDSADRADRRRRCQDLGALEYLAAPLTPQSLTVFLRRVQRLVAPPPTCAAEDAPGSGEEMAPGLLVHLCIDSGPAAGGYRAVVVDLGPASFSVMAHPSSQEAQPYMPLGTVVRVGFPSSRGWGEFATSIAGSYARGALHEVTLSLPEHVVYRQRRRWPRREAMLPIRAWPTTPPDRAGVMVSGHTEDIGEAGARAVLHAPLPVAQFVTLAIDAGGKPLRVGARAIWYEPPLGLVSSVSHRYGFQFVRVRHGTRARIRALLGRAGSDTGGVQSGELGLSAAPLASPPTPPTGCGSGDANLPAH